MAHELAAQNLSPRLNEVRTCHVKNATEWTRDNHFELIKVDYGTCEYPTYCHIYPDQENPFASRENMIPGYLSKQHSDFHIIYALKAIVCYTKSFERFDILSPSYDFLICEDARFWLNHLKGFGIYQAISTDLTKVLVNFTGLDSISIKGRCLFIGGSANWGHWMQDCLPKIIALEKLSYKEDVKLVFGPLSKNQRSCLSILGINQEKIIELNLESKPGKAIRYCFDELIIAETPKTIALKYLRNRFTSKNIEIHPVVIPQPEFIYISRRSQFPRHRIYNIDQVEEFFIAKGFHLIDNLAKITTEELIYLLSKAKIIVVTTGADMGNLSLCRQDVVCISLISDGFLRFANQGLVVNQEIPNIYGIGLPTIRVVGKSINTCESLDKNVLVQIDGLAIYRIEDLDRAVEAAIEFRRSASFHKSITTG